MMCRADKILKEYSARRLDLIRQTFDIAKNQITSSFEVIKFPLKTTHDNYKIITKPGFIANDIGERADLNVLMKGVIKGHNIAKNAAKSGMCAIFEIMWCIFTY